MVKKLKIPSRRLLISGNHFYKGYYAEYRERLRQGEFLIVHLGSTGQEITVPIENIIFLMDNAPSLRYVPVQTGLGLVEVGKEEKGEIVTVKGTDEDNSLNTPLFVIDKNQNENENENEDNSLNTKRKRSTSSNEGDYDEPDQEYQNTFNELTNALIDSVPLNQNIITEMLQIMFSLLGFVNMNNVSINTHSMILQNHLNSPVFKKIAFNEDLYKTFVLAYIFIYINNMNLGYPLKIEGCRLTSNDDPKFILCVAIKSGFIKPLTPDFNINTQIAMLLNVMNTKIVPSSVNVNIGDKFSFLRVSNTTKNTNEKNKPTIKLSPKQMRFPLLDKNVNLQIQVKVKNLIIEKVQYRLKNDSDLENVKVILQYFIDNFDTFLSGPLFFKLNNNPELIESQILIPYIKEYKKLIDLQENIFYKNMSKTSIINSVPQLSEINKDLQEKVILNVNKKLLDTVNNGIQDKVKENSILYILENYADILRLSHDNIKSLKIGLNTDNINEKIMKEAIIEYKNTIKKTYEFYKEKQKESSFKQKLKQYNKKIKM